MLFDIPPGLTQVLQEVKTTIVSCNVDEDTFDVVLCLRGDVEEMHVNLFRNNNKDQMRTNALSMFPVINLLPIHG